MTNMADPPGSLRRTQPSGHGDLFLIGVAKKGSKDKLWKRNWLKADRRDEGDDNENNILRL